MAIVVPGVPRGLVAFVLFGFRLHGEEPVHSLVRELGSIEAGPQEHGVQQRGKPKQKRAQPAQAKRRQKPNMRSRVLELTTRRRPIRSLGLDLNLIEAGPAVAAVSQHVFTLRGCRIPLR